MISPIFWTKNGDWAIQYVDGFWQVFDEDGDYITEFQTAEEMVGFINSEQAKRLVS